MELLVTTADDGDGRHVVTVTGAVDIANRGEVVEAGRAAIERPGSSFLLLDLEHVTFIDSSGIGALVEVSGDAEDAGIKFALRNPSARVRRVLQITGLLDTWTVESAGGGAN